MHLFRVTSEHRIEPGYHLAPQESLEEGRRIAQACRRGETLELVASYEGDGDEKAQVAWAFETAAADRRSLAFQAAARGLTRLIVDDMRARGTLADPSAKKAPSGQGFSV
jgi:hypothetical protein